MKNVFVHPTALVETQQIGEGTRVWAYSHILDGVSIGENCNIGDHCFFEKGAVVGSSVTIKNGNMLFEGITLEDGVFVGPHVFFTNDLYPRSPRLAEAKYRYENHEWFSPTRIKYGASLGAAAVILAGVTIGEFCMVGAGSVVTKDTLPYSLVVGSPAHVVGWVCRCGLRLSFDENHAVCAGCNSQYKLEDGQVQPV